MNALPDETLLKPVFNKGHETGMALVSLEGQWLKVNDYLCQMLGYEEEELLRMTFLEITHPEDLAAEQPYLQRLTAGAIDHYQFQKRYLRKDGVIVWGELNRSVMRDEARQPQYFISHIRDITAEKKSAEGGFHRLRVFGATLAGRIRGWFGR